MELMKDEKKEKIKKLLDNLQEKFGKRELVEMLGGGETMLPTYFKPTERFYRQLEALKLLDDFCLIDLYQKRIEEGYEELKW